MTAAEINPPPVLPEPIPRPEQTLRRLFLTLFLRGRGARGLNKQGAPKSIGDKLALTLVFYALFGCMALAFLHQPVFALAAYLHAMTFVFLGMFVASSAGEILFNKEEADILMQGYAKDGDNQPVKDFAADTDKAVKMHLDMAQKLDASTKSASNQ